MVTCILRLLVNSVSSYSRLWPQKIKFYLNDTPDFCVVYKYIWNECEQGPRVSFLIYCLKFHCTKETTQVVCGSVAVIQLSGWYWNDLPPPRLLRRSVCVSQHRGSYPVASPGSSAQLGQFVKLEKDFCIFCGSFLVMLLLKQPISSAYYCVDPEEEEDAVNVASSKVCGSSSYLEGIGGGICLFFVEMKQGKALFF